MKLKIGTIVRVREDILVKDRVDNLSVLSEMKDLAGKVVTIKDFGELENRYRIKEDGFYWCAELFEPVLPYEVGDTVALTCDCYHLKEGNTTVVTGIRESTYQCGPSTDFIVSIDGVSGGLYEGNFEKYEEPAATPPKEVVPTPEEIEVPENTSDYQAVIDIAIRDDQGEYYEKHTYYRHAENAAESEKLFWSMLDRYAKDSFFDGMSIELTLWVNGTKKMDVTAKPSE